MPSQKTLYLPKALSEDVCTYYYEFLSQTVEWKEGVRSKNGFTRKAFQVTTDSPLFQELTCFIDAAYTKLKDVYNDCVHSYDLLGIYLNYYENGEMWTPNHTHRGTQQLVISLGNPRTLILGPNRYTLSNGDVILFGSSIHGVPKEDVNTGRISIATFMKMK